MNKKLIQIEVWKELVNLEPHTVNLSQIFLDPNNPRLQTPNKQRVSDDRIQEKGVQDSCSKQIKDYGINDLIESIKTSGFWTVDRIVLKPLKDNNFVVLEGNRRIVALKTLEEAHQKGVITLPTKVFAGIIQFEALIYKGKNPHFAWIIQGFRHTPGIKSWGEYPKAMFLAEFEKESKKSISEIASIFGMRVIEVTHLIRSYYGFEDAKKDEDYGNDLSPEKFGHFRDIIFKKDELEKWLGWNDKKRKFNNKKNLKKYLSWAVPGENEEEPKISISPSTRDNLPKIIKNKKIFEKFEEGTSLDESIKELREVETKREEIDMQSIISDIEDAIKTIETLPIPRLQLAERGTKEKEKKELIKKMEELQKILNTQIKNLELKK